MAFGASEAARWQAYQTRARMGAHLWFQIITTAVLGWVALTLYVVWRQTGVFYPQLDHQYFWYWVFCGIIVDTPLLDLCAPNLKVPAPGGWYPLPGFTQWLDGPQLYHLPFTTWFVHYGVRTALVPLGLGAVALAWRAHHHLDVEHLCGLRLLAPREHNRQLGGGRLVRLHSGRRRGIRLGASIIPGAKECEHFLITGSPGAGKSTLIRHMLAQVQERRQSAIVIDPDCEFVQEFYNDTRGDVVLNPLDARCPFWSPWLEFRADSFAMDAEAMAASLIRSQARTPTEEFFRESGRTLIESALTVIRDRNDARSLLDFFSHPRLKIHEKLAGTRAHPLIDPGAHEQGSGILATAANAIKSFYHLPAHDQTGRTWSAREWAQTREGWVFLSCTEDARAAIQRLQGVWLDSLVRWLMSAEIGSGQVWIMADELPALGYQPQIEKLVTRGPQARARRSHGLSERLAASVDLRTRRRGHPHQLAHHQGHSALR